MVLVSRHAWARPGPLFLFSCLNNTAEETAVVFDLSGVGSATRDGLPCDRYEVPRRWASLAPWPAERCRQEDRTSVWPHLHEPLTFSLVARIFGAQACRTMGSHES